MSNFFKPLFRFVPVSGLATFVDFGTSYLVLHYLSFSYAWSTIVGNVAGGIIGFVLSRLWVFQDSKTEKSQWQLMKYILVSMGSSVMNTLGVLGLSKIITADYLIIRALVGTFVFVVYSYGLNRLFVFNAKNHEKISI
ncbi:GtrA family protein [Arcicella aquatica]|uniref:GtrA family protein n=1 Tax=Arcicella aquatica TaxID=217141 RepID=A0ABU5QQ43_9BACT|nr:GtrA family protein [Arcicella aquatica]MEA5259208.1 GtrA family protein [Arcicella aquatica]